MARHSSKTNSRAKTRGKTREKDRRNRNQSNDMLMARKVRMKEVFSGMEKDDTSNLQRPVLVPEDIQDIQRPICTLFKKFWSKKTHEISTTEKQTVNEANKRISDLKNPAYTRYQIPDDLFEQISIVKRSITDFRDADAATKIEKETLISLIEKISKLSDAYRAIGLDWRLVTPAESYAMISDFFVHPAAPHLATVEWFKFVRILLQKLPQQAPLLDQMSMVLEVIRNDNYSAAIDALRGLNKKMAEINGSLGLTINDHAFPVLFLEEIVKASSDDERKRWHSRLRFVLEKLEVSIPPSVGEYYNQIPTFNEDRLELWNWVLNNTLTENAQLPDLDLDADMNVDEEDTPNTKPNDQTKGNPSGTNQNPIFVDDDDDLAEAPYAGIARSPTDYPPGSKTLAWGGKNKGNMFYINRIGRADACVYRISDVCIFEKGIDWDSAPPPDKCVTNSLNRKGDEKKVVETQQDGRTIKSWKYTFRKRHIVGIWGVAFDSTKNPFPHLPDYEAMKQSNYVNYNKKMQKLGEKNIRFIGCYIYVKWRGDDGTFYKSWELRDAIRNSERLGKKRTDEDVYYISKDQSRKFDSAYSGLYGDEIKRGSSRSESPFLYVRRHDSMEAEAEAEAGDTRRYPTRHSTSPQNLASPIIEIGGPGAQYNRVGTGSADPQANAMQSAHDLLFGSYFKKYGVTNLADLEEKMDTDRYERLYDRWTKQLKEVFK